MIVSYLPFYLITDRQLVDIEFSFEDLKKNIHADNPNKSHEHDNISIRMPLICGDPILVPLRPGFS